MTIYEWAQRWNIPPAALNELLNMPLPDSMAPIPGTESSIQQDIRLEASRTGRILWRNNNGAAVADDGRHLRFGLGNDSKRINDAFKSSDLIGITPVIIDACHVGRTIGVFTAVEVKRGDWSWSGTDREQAQWRYIQLVNRMGGFATFAKSTKDYEQCLKTNV